MAVHSDDAIRRPVYVQVMGRWTELEDLTVCEVLVILGGSRRWARAARPDLSSTEENLHEACQIMGGCRDRIIPRGGIQRRGSRHRSRQQTHAHVFPGYLERAVYICRCRNTASPRL